MGNTGSKSEMMTRKDGPQFKRFAEAVRRKSYFCFAIYGLSLPDFGTEKTRAVRCSVPAM